MNKQIWIHEDGSVDVVGLNNATTHLEYIQQHPEKFNNTQNSQEILKHNYRVGITTPVLYIETMDFDDSILSKLQRYIPNEMIVSATQVVWTYGLEQFIIRVSINSFIKAKSIYNLKNEGMPEYHNIITQYRNADMNIPQEIIDAYWQFRKQTSKYPAYAGNYDKTHGDKIKETRLYNKLISLINKHRLDEIKTLGALGNIKQASDTIFTTSTTDMPMYDNYLENPKYALAKKGIKTEIENMIPDQYDYEATKILGTDPYSYSTGVFQSSIKQIREFVNSGNKLPMPVLDYTEYGGQEGRNRAEFARRNGIKLFRC